MEWIRSDWLFFQDQVLGMKWLNELIGNGLAAVGLDGTLGGMVQFFFYAPIKLFVLPSVLIVGRSSLPSYVPPQRPNRMLGRVHD